MTERISGQTPPISSQSMTQSVATTKKSESLGHSWKQLSTGQKVSVAVLGILTSAVSPLLGAALSFGLIKLLSKSNMRSESTPLATSARKTDRQSKSHDIQPKENKMSSEMTDDFMIMEQRTGGGHKPTFHQEPVLTTPQISISEKAGRVVSEMVTTEKNFGSDMQVSVKALKNIDSESKLIKKMAGSFDKLSVLSGQFSKMIEEAKSDPKKIVEAYSSKTFSNYCKTAKTALKDFPKFKEELKKYSGSLNSFQSGNLEMLKNRNVISVMQNAVQRLPRHEMLLKSLASEVGDQKSLFDAPIKHVQAVIESTEK